ncbi:MAG: hypothetical protein M1840_006530 [Geoglossum simile]|nr:MAG: hypothetical protein M1840_006530 [Geoglossum simile]
MRPTAIFPRRLGPFQSVRLCQLHSRRLPLARYQCFSVPALPLRRLHRPRSWGIPTTGTVLLGALGPAAFVQLSEGGDDDHGRTAEERMLQASMDEVKHRVPDGVHGSSRVGKVVMLLLDTYVIEPVCTGLRLIHLVVIFVPVIFAVPLIWCGARRKDGSNERSGTLLWYSFLVNAMERAGPAFIKLGQWAASRSDIFPTELCSAMSSLHSNAPPHSLHATKRTLVQAFNGRPFEEIFDEFDEVPLGVGAIAQCYRAKLKPGLAVPSVEADLEERPWKLRHNIRKNVDMLVKSTPHSVPSSYVAIKVLHPRVERTVRRDLRIMKIFAVMLNAIPTMEWLSLPDEVDQFGEMMRLQLDLRIEAANLSVFRKNFKKRSTASFPAPHTEYTTRHVLIEEFAAGIPLNAFLEDGGGVFQHEIADEGLDAFLHMLLIDNFVHADLHPGNIMVRFYKPKQLDYLSRLSPWLAPKVEDGTDVTEEVLSRLRPHRHNPQEWIAQLSQFDKEGYRPQLIFIDTGLVTQLNQINRRNFLDLFKAVAEFDGYKAGHLMVERCRQPDAVIDEEIFALKMQHLVLGVKSRTFALGNIKVGDVLSEVLSMIRTHHVRLEGDFVNVVISILLLEGIGRSLDPGIDLFKRFALFFSFPFDISLRFGKEIAQTKISQYSALPILRQLGAQSGAEVLKTGDISLLKVWVALETRVFLQASVEDVERCVKYDQLSPNV